MNFTLSKLISRVLSGTGTNADEFMRLYVLGYSRHSNSILVFTNQDNFLFYAHPVPDIVSELTPSPEKGDFLKHRLYKVDSHGENRIILPSTERFSRNQLVTILKSDDSSKPILDGKRSSVTSVIKSDSLNLDYLSLALQIANYMSNTYSPLKIRDKILLGIRDREDQLRW